ncbi:MAG: hypothetical protein Q9227_002217 [Pyrenula ochraceoflavens]
MAKLYVSRLIQEALLTKVTDPLAQWTQEFEEMRPFALPQVPLAQSKRTLPNRHTRKKQAEARKRWDVGFEAQNQGSGEDSESALERPEQPSQPGQDQTPMNQLEDAALASGMEHFPDIAQRQDSPSSHMSAEENDRQARSAGPLNERDTRIADASALPNASKTSLASSQRGPEGIEDLSESSDDQSSLRRSRKRGHAGGTPQHLRHPMKLRRRPNMQSPSPANRRSTPLAGPTRKQRLPKAVAEPHSGPYIQGTETQAFRAEDTSRESKSMEEDLVVQDSQDSDASS